MAYPLATSSPLAYVGVGKQSSKGTGVTPTLFVPYRGSVSLDHAQAGESVYEAGTGPYVNRQMKTGHDPAGGFGLGARPNTFSALAAYFLGADSVSGTGPYLHTLTPGVAAIWVSVEQAAGDDGDIIERFVDALLKTMTVSVEGNQDLMATFGWTSLSSAWISTAADPTYESGVNGSTPGANMRASDIAYTIDGSSEVNVQSFEIALEWKLDEDIRLSEVTRETFLKLELSGTVKCKQLLNDTDTRDAYRKINYGSASGTAPSAEFFGAGSFVALADNGLTTTNERELSLTVPAIDWTKAKYTDLDPAGQTIYVEREGTIKKGSNPFVTFACKTSDSSAYI